MMSDSIAAWMNKDFAVVYPDMPVVEASGKLINKEMLGGPVIDAGGTLLGWISAQECLQVAIQVVYHNQRRVIGVISRRQILKMLDNKLAEMVKRS